MIEKLKQRPKSINQENLSHVNSWWDKALVKNSHQVEKQISRFKSDKLVLNSDAFSKNNIDYDEYLTFSNKVLEFWIQKDKKMSKEIRIVQKFNKMISSFGEQAAILANLQAIDAYFTQINQKDVANKHELAIEIGNQTTLTLYNAYKDLIVKMTGKDPTIKEKLSNLFETDVVNEKELFNPLPSLKILFKFTNLAFRNKKISQEEFSVIYFNTIFLNSYLSTFLNLYHRFSMQIQ